MTTQCLKTLCSVAIKISYFTRNQFKMYRPSIIEMGTAAKEDKLKLYCISHAC